MRDQAVSLPSYLSIEERLTLLQKGAISVEKDKNFLRKYVKRDGTVVAREVYVAGERKLEYTGSTGIMQRH